MSQNLELEISLSLSLSAPQNFETQKIQRMSLTRMISIVYYLTESV